MKNWTLAQRFAFVITVNAGYWMLKLGYQMGSFSFATSVGLILAASRNLR